MIEKIFNYKKEINDGTSKTKKSNSGITITSLTIYVIVATIIVGILVFLNANFFSNINDLTEKANIVSECLDFKSAFIKDLKSENNMKVTDYNDNMIRLSNNVKYEFRVLDKSAKDKKYAIYRNDVQIAKDVVTHTTIDGQEVKEGPYFEYDIDSNTIRVGIKFFDGKNTYIENGVYLVGKADTPSRDSQIVDSYIKPSDGNSGDTSEDVSGDNSGETSGEQNPTDPSEPQEPDISEIPENERVFAVLYKDGTLQIGNTDILDPNKEVAQNFGETSFSISNSNPEWLAYKESIEVIDFKGTNKIELKTAENLFSGCTNLVEIKNVQYLETSEVTSMSNMFSDCKSLENVTLSGIDTSNVEDMSEMFSGCTSLKTVNLDTLTTTSLTDMSNMFANCTSMVHFNIANLDTTKVTSISKMFYNCQSLQSVTIYSIKAKGLTDLSYLFYNCMNLNSIDFGQMDTSDVTDMSYMFANCVKLGNLNMSSVDTSSVENMEGMFYNCQNLGQIMIEGLEMNNVTNTSKMFEGCIKANEIRFASNVDTSKVKNMSAMFKNCSSINNFNLSQYNNFKTSSVTDMSEMFYGCSNLSQLSLTNFDTSSVLNFTSMFESCTNLSNLNLTSFDNSMSQKMNRMFMNDVKLTSIQVSDNWKEDYTNIDTTDMFNGCGTDVVSK